MSCCLRSLSSKSIVFLCSFRLLNHTLKAISPIAKTKAATAATESPAICAGVILGLSSAVVGTGADVGVADDVGDGNDETVSTKAD